jgi:hypothetical protein
MTKLLVPLSFVLSFVAFVYSGIATITVGAQARQNSQLIEQLTSEVVVPHFELTQDIVKQCECAQ